MRRHQNKDFEPFYLDTRDRVFRTILVIVRDRSLAEDAFSEAYTRALAQWSTLARHPAPAAWVVKTALNYLRSTQRTAARTATQEIPEVPASDDPPTDPELVRQLLALPERQREIVALRVVLGLDTDRTAELLDIAPSTVKTHLSRALSRLEDNLTEIAAEEAWR